ncbi:MAG: formylglycine-generating enzyme family protein [Deltaproteobacteria bacterium]|nr:formylglycine-generating enzyme family protein [Deltaproteobacteria bacterium]MBN2674106.1 formylglycine-generating enzyme family protein [Deltaproteobacteria bacterium]
MEQFRKITFICVFVMLSGCSCNANNGAVIDADTDSDTNETGGSDSTNTDTGPVVIDEIIDTDPSREMKWINVEAGSFIFGSPEGTPCRSAYAEDQVNVTLTHNIEVAETEVTQHQWKQSGLSLPPQSVDGDNFPVTWINFYEALAFCNALSEKAGFNTCYDLATCSGEFATACPEGELYESGCGCSADDCSDSPNIYFCANEIHKYENWYECTGYRLPTTAEWEYFAKAGTTTTTYNGDVLSDAKYSCHDQPVLNDIAWYCYNSGEQLHPVAWKQPNSWGIYDILGNASEWVDYFTDGLSLDYMDGHPGEDLVDPIGPQSGQGKDLRGYDFRSIGCRMRAARQKAVPPDSRGIYVGFRPVRTLSK